MFKKFMLFWLILELIIFFLVADWLGLLTALILIVVPMLAGGALMRWQGVEVLKKAQLQGLAASPGTAFESMAVVLGGILFMMPGILSSLIGLGLFIPKLREKLSMWLLSKGFSQMNKRNKAFKGRTIDTQDWKEL